MELVVKNNNNGKKTANKSKKNSKTTVVVNAPVQVSRKSKKAGKSKKNKSAALNLRDRFLRALSRPDIMGPQRIPRTGGNTRTVLGYDKTYSNLGSTTQFLLVIANSKYSSAYSTYSAVSSTSAWTAGSTTVPASQYPPAASATDVNLTAACVNTSYVGAPLSVTGEIIMGTIPSNSILTNATWESLASYPSVIKMPLKDLIFDGEKSSKTAFLRKISPAADEFHGTTTDMADIELPFFAISPTAAVNVVTFQIHRAWEVRPQITSGNVIPYEISDDSFTYDMNQYQDASAKLSEVPYPVQDTFGEYFQTVWKIANYAVPLAISSYTSYLDHVSRGHTNRIRYDLA